jgi:hypothetical protein
MSDDEILDAIEAFEDTPPPYVPTPEERIAARSNTRTLRTCRKRTRLRRRSESDGSTSRRTKNERMNFELIKRNYDLGLWTRRNIGRSQGRNTGRAERRERARRRGSENRAGRLDGGRKNT